MTEITTIRSIQIANTEDGSYDVMKPLPYPYHVLPDGKVDRQDFWRGDPAGLIGFQREAKRHQVDVTFQDWVDNDVDVTGMFPVFVDDKGQFAVITLPITDVTVTNR